MTLVEEFTRRLNDDDFKLKKQEILEGNESDEYIDQTTPRGSICHLEKIVSTFKNKIWVQKQQQQPQQQQRQPPQLEQEQEKGEEQLARGWRRRRTNRRRRTYRVEYRLSDQCLGDRLKEGCKSLDCQVMSLEVFGGLKNLSCDGGHLPEVVCGQNTPDCSFVVASPKNTLRKKACGWIPYQNVRDTMMRHLKILGFSLESPDQVTWKLYFEPLGLKIGPYQKSVDALRRMKDIEDMNPPRTSDKEAKDFSILLREAEAQLQESQEYHCKCETPGAGTAGHNKYTCDDGTFGYCATEETCYATFIFPKHVWHDGCQ